MRLSDIISGPVLEWPPRRYKPELSTMLNPFSFLTEHRQWFSFEKSRHFDRASSRWLRVNITGRPASGMEMAAIGFRKWRASLRNLP